MDDHELIAAVAGGDDAALRERFSRHAPWLAGRLNAAMGLAASAASGAAAAVTFGWLVPMTAVCALALAAATLARSAKVGVIVGVAGWVIVVLAGQSASGRLTAVITDSFLVLPYLGFAAVCAAIAWAATRIPRGTS
jgi:hypothetical protein